MSDLTTVNNTLKKQNELLKGNRAQELENIREQARKDAEMLKILSNLKPTVNIDGKESKGGFLTAVLTGLGLVGAGALSLAGGLLAGWIQFSGQMITTMIKLFIKFMAFVGKKLLKLIDKIPRPKWLDEFINMFKKEGKIGQTFTKIKNFFMGETSVFKRIGTLVDSAIDGVKSFGGDIFTRIKTFFVGETSIFKRIGTLVDSAIDGVKSFGGGIFTRIKTFFVGETSIFKRIAKILDPIIDSVKGFSGGIFTKIGNFFIGETSIFTRMKTALDPVIDIVKGMDGGIFTKIGNVFQSIKNFGASLLKPFAALGDLLGMGSDAAKVAGEGGGILATIMKPFKLFGTVIKSLANFGKIIAAPLTIIMGLIDAGFETKDAYDKSEGFFATIINGIIGAIGGFVDGAIFQVADLLKDGISWIAGFFNFKEIEKTLDSFSFSEIFNEVLDDVYKAFNKLFSNPMGLLRDLSDSVLGSTITNQLFGKKVGNVKFEDFRDEEYFGKDKVELEDLQKSLKMMNLDQIKRLSGEFEKAGDFENKEDVERAFELAMKSRQNAQTSGGGAPVIINNNNVDNSMQSSQTTAVSIPAPTRTNESTVRALQMN